MKKVLTALAMTALATTFATTAHADPGGTLDWGKALVDLDAWARGNAEKPQATPSPTMNRERLEQPYVHTAGNAWFGVAPSVTLVARDWASTYKIAGDRLSLVDALRLSESTRMVVSRVRLSSFNVSRLTPFAQLGVGQWRTDTNLVPVAVRSMEVATQVGGGIELSLTRSWQLAGEATATMIVRDEREYDNLPQTRIWSSTIASRITF
jgi:hypothetical protein